jgi:hypothetical protein
MMPDLLELFHERAAIIEFDAGLPRAESEKRAYFELRMLYGRHAIPYEVIDIIENIYHKGLNENGSV